MQGRKLISNAVAGLSRLHDTAGAGTKFKRKGKSEERISNIDHPIIWDGTGRAQYVLACHRLQVRPNPSVIHQLGQTEMAIDIGPLIVRRSGAAYTSAHAGKGETHRQGLAREQLTSNGIAILEALHHNSLATSLQ